jgi:hypothetical protein
MREALGQDDRSSPSSSSSSLSSSSATKPVRVDQLQFEQRMTKLRETIQQDTGAIIAILTPAQFERLRQISRQVRGVSVFSDTDVASALQLTKAQKSFIGEVQKSREDKWIDRGPGDHGPGGPGDRGPGGPGGPGDRDRGPGDRGPGERGPGGPGGPGERKFSNKNDDDGSDPGGNPGGPRFAGRRRGPNFEEFADRRRESIAADVAKVVTQLSPQQAATWKSLIGEVFDRDLLSGAWTDFGGGGPPHLNHRDRDRDHAARGGRDRDGRDGGRRPRGPGPGGFGNGFGPP